MPIYEYACDSCGNQFEVKQKFSDPPVTSCEKCGEDVRKLISVPGIVFKGTGWYVTDYSNKFKDPSQATDGQKGEEKKKGDKKEGTTGEAKTGEGSSSGTSSTTKSESSSSSTPSSPSSTSSS